MASRNARRRKTKGKAKTAPAAASTVAPARARGTAPVPAAAPHVDEPPIFARLVDEFGGRLADPPGTVWGRPADTTRRGMAAGFLQLWPGSRHAAMAAAADPTLADDPGPDLYAALAVPATPGSWLDDDVTGFLPQLEVAHV